MATSSTNSWARSSLAALVTCLSAAVGLSLLTAAPAHAVDTHAKPLYLSVAATVSGQTSSGVVPLRVGQAATLNAACVYVEPAPTNCDSAGVVKYVWSHDAADNTPTSVVAFDSPGMKTVRVTASIAGSQTLQGSGEGYISFAVYEPFADQEQLEEDNTVLPAGVVTAASLMQACRTYAASTGVREGRALFCPNPPSGMGLSSPYRIPTNAITGASCLDNPTACGLPAGLDVAGQVSSGLVNSSGNVLVRPTVCVDNAVSVTQATNRGTALVTRRGVEQGCATYADVLAAAVGMNVTSATTPTPAVARTATRTNVTPNPVAETSLSGWAESSSTLTRTTVDSPVSSRGVRWTSTVNADDSAAPDLNISVGSLVAGRTYTVSVYVQASPQENDVLASIRDASGTAFAQATWLAPVGGWSRISLTGIPTASGNAVLNLSMPTATRDDAVEITGVMAETSTSPSTFTLTTTPSVCAQGPDPDSTSVLGAALLGGARLCDTDAALLKGEAYELVSRMLRLPDTSFTATNIKDTGDAAVTAAVNKMLAAGAPLVGELACSDGVGVCFNPNQAITRSELARLLAFSVNGYTGASALAVTVTGTSSDPRLGVPYPLSVRVDVPSYYPPGSSVVVASTGNVPGTVSCPTAPVTVPPTGSVTVACAFTGNSIGSANLTLSAAIPTLGVSASGTASFTVVNDPPVITSKEADVAVALYSNEGEPGTSTELYFYDPEGLKVVAGVRSCNPAVDVDAEGRSLCPTSGPVFPKTGKPRTLTPDSDPAAFVDTADVETGTVYLGSVRGNTTARVTYEPDKPKIFGQWSFVLQVCDVGGGCADKLFIVDRANVNDPPVANPVSVTTGDDPVQFSLTGTDEDGVVTAVRINSIDVDGTLQFNDSGTWNPVVASFAYPIDTVFRWNPPNGPSGAWTSTFAVRDNGGAGGADPLWSAPATLQLVRVRPVGPPVAALTVTPLAGPAKSTEVTLDASASASEAGDGISSYLFNFGDGAALGPVTTPVVTHRYNRAGTFTVTVTVTDARGKTDSTERSFTSEVNLVANPTFDFSVNGWSAVAGLSTLSRKTPGLNGSEGALEVRTGSGVCAVEESTPSVVGVPGMVTGPFTGSAWVKAPSGSVDKIATMSLVETTPAGVSVAVSKHTVVLSGSAQYLSVAHTLSQPTNLLRVAFDVNTPPAGDCLVVDDVGLVPPG